MKLLPYWKIFSAMLLPAVCFIIFITTVYSYPHGWILIETNKYGEMIPEIIMYGFFTLLSLIGGIATLKEIKNGKLNT